MSSPPTYDEAMKQLQDLQNRGMSAEEQATVYNAMSAKVQSSSDDVKEGVKKLADQAIKTDRTFESIRTQLALIDQNDYKDKGGQPVAKLQPTWVKYQRRYIDLLWRSRKAATQTEAYLRDLVNVVFSVVLEKDSIYEDNVKDLTAFANRPNPVKVKEQDDDFTKLQADVTGFVAKFSTFAEAEGAKLAGQITALTGEINGLKKELVDLTRLVEQMGIAIGVTVGAGTAGIIAALLVLGTATAGTAIIPILITGIAAIIGEVSQLIVALQRKITVESSIAEKQRQIDQLSNEQKILEDLLAKLKLCADEGSDMFGRLANFSDMWSTCAEDARNLLKVVANIHTDKAVQARIQLMSSTYKSAADALAYYATCIDGSHLLSPDATQNS